MEGDEILRAADGKQSWNTFEEIREGGTWGQGVIGTPLTVWVRRGDEEKEIQIVRGLVQGFQMTYDQMEPDMSEFFTDWSDVKAHLVDVIENGDMVAFQAEYQGNNVRFGRSAVWNEFGFLRIRDGKITDWWNSDEEVSTLLPLGYNIHAPELVKA
jgi:ketosteroid isomerase-like protein